MNCAQKNFCMPVTMSKKAKSTTKWQKSSWFILIYRQTTIFTQMNPLPFDTKRNKKTFRVFNEGDEKKTQFNEFQKQSKIVKL